MSATLYIADSRSMYELDNGSVDLVVTSPPYWHIKDYGVQNQIGYGQSLHEYLKDLYRVFSECFRVLKEGSRLCVNIGDQFARSVVYGRYKVIPLHAEVISMCEDIGYDYMGSIIWQKKTTMNTTGGAVIMGSFPYPPNGIVEIDYEFILIFKKPGKKERVDKTIKERSKLSKEEWKEYFSGHWKIGGARQINHEAVFPEEVPRRLIKMFSFYGDTVLDPFVGSGTTLKVALELGRNSIGYEINPEFLNVIRDKVGALSVKVIERESEPGLSPVNYEPKIKDAEPVLDEKKLKFNGDRYYKVVDVLSENEVLLDTGLKVKLLGVQVPDDRKERAITYLKEYVKGKKVLLKFDTSMNIADKNCVEAYLYLRNKIFINRKMIQMGLGEVDTSKEFSYKDKFMEVTGG